MKKEIKINALEDLAAALRTREARNNPGKAIITRVPVDNPGVAGAPVVWINEASEISEEQYAELSKRPTPLGVWVSQGRAGDD